MQIKHAADPHAPVIQAPRVRPSTLSWHARCARRLRLELTGGAARVVGARGNRDRRFALRQAVVDATRTAHEQAPSGGGALVAACRRGCPPEGLTTEERILFRRALRAYGAWAAPLGGKPARASRWLRERSATGRFTLSVGVDLALAHSDGSLEIRTLGWRLPRGPVAELPRAQVTALLLRHRPMLRYSHVALPDGRRVAHDFPFEGLREVGAAVGRQVMDALDGPPAASTPGPWCADCPFTRSCPALAHTLVEAVKTAAPDRPTPLPAVA